MLSVDEFLDSVGDDESENIAIDFDGVIHDDYDGWGDGTIYGSLIDGAIDAIKKLSEKYNIIIFSAKVKPDRPLVNGKTGIELVREWLEKHDLMKFVSEITAEKPRAVVYIDDKGIRFTNWKDAISDLERLDVI